MKIIGVAGAIGAGKSEFSNAIASDLQGTRLSFGDLVRAEAQARGLDPTRERLQALGEELFNELGAAGLVRRLLDSAPTTELLVVDGVRHLAIDDELQRSSADYFLVFVEVDDDTRRRRLIDREGQDVDLATLDQHSTELETPLLRRRAAAVVRGDDTPAALRRIRHVFT